jgi:hypothetical protein
MGIKVEVKPMPAVVFICTDCDGVLEQLFTFGSGDNTCRFRCKECQAQPWIEYAKLDKLKQLALDNADS